MIAPPLFTLRRGTGRLVLSIPHAGTYLPPEIAAQLTDIGRGVLDTDWHVDRLYDFVQQTDATILTATYSRTVVDLNRGPDGGKLYPGQAETGICPSESFDGDPLYTAAAPDAAEIAARVAAYWRPYHAALQTELDRVRGLHGTAHLFDAHSIRARVPRLFEGTLPDLNIGTHGGVSCDPALTEKVVAAAGTAFSVVVNGRFKGGYITRHYGNPGQGVHALQLELAQTTHLDEANPKSYQPAMAADLIAVLKNIIEAFQ